MVKRADLRRVDGLLLLDKPSGVPSNAALQRARRALKAAKAGHTGTLDPMATGLLPICLGNATRLAGALLNSDKSYQARLILGIRTDTGDREGRILSERPVDLERNRIDDVLNRFVGVQMQIPPMYSALKRGGRPLYEYARRGETVDRPEREIRIDRITLEALTGNVLDISVDCGKGTYIRSLADDIGEFLGCGAHLSGLRRTRIGDFDVGMATPLEELEAVPPEERDGRLLPPDALLRHMARIDLDSDSARCFRQGQAIGTVSGKPGEVRVYADGSLIGVGSLDAGSLKPKQVFTTI